MAQTVDIRGLHLHGAHHHAGGAKSPRRSRSPVAEDDTATAQNSPSLNATQSEDTVSVDSRDLEQVDRELAAAVVAGLTTKAVEVEIDGEKQLLRSLPTVLLYDHTGLAIYDEIVQLPEYYLVPAETAIFENQGKEIIDAALAGAENGVAFLELGCGSMEKTKHLLKHLADHPLGPKCTYYAVDLDPSTLDAVVASAQAAFPTLHFVGLNGSYDDALAFLNRGGLDPHPHVDRKKCVFWFGSSIGNFDREAATSFVTTWSAALNPNDLFAIAIDRRNEKQKIELAYNDPAGVTARFCLNGLVHANRLLSSLHPLPESEYYFDPKDWTYFSRYDEQKGRHEAYFRCTKPDGLLIPLPESESLAPEDPIRTHSSDDFAGGLQIAENELVHIEFSYKYSPDESSALAAEAGLRTDRIFTSPNNEYDLHLFHKPTLLFPSSSGTSPPTKKEWEALWSAWELITEQMIPRERILEKPISLRHPFVFYAGHIPAFADIIVDKALQWGLLEPRGYAEVFERGIDPDMDDPTKCHPHSLVPDTWPQLDEILDYKERVKARVYGLLESLASGSFEGRKIVEGTERSLWMAYEHTALHLETILYMLVQSGTFVPPVGVARPVAKVAELETPQPSAIFKVEGGALKRGLQKGVIGWDNESPEIAVTVAPFEVQERPVTNIEYLEFLDSVLPADWRTAEVLDPLVPASWEVAEGEVLIKTALGRLPILVGQHWPVFTSLTHAQAYAESRGMRLPTENEVALLLELEAQNGSQASANVGFVKFHPDDVVQGSGLRHVLGHGWEWSTTEFAPFDGFQIDPMYPGYSSDFFDGTHVTLLGGSWATVPSIAGRRSFRNWYQRGYPYVFAKFRLCV